MGYVTRRHMKYAMKYLIRGINITTLKHLIYQWEDPACLLAVLRQLSVSQSVYWLVIPSHLLSAIGKYQRLIKDKQLLIIL